MDFQSTSGHFSQLDDSLLLNICENLDCKERLNLGKTCKTMYEAYKKIESQIESNQRNAYANKLEPVIKLDASNVALINFVLAKENKDSNLKLFEENLEKSAKIFGFNVFKEVFDASPFKSNIEKELYKKICNIIRKYLVKNDYAALFINICHRHLCDLAKKDEDAEAYPIEEAIAKYPEMNPNGRPIILFNNRIRGKGDKFTYLQKIDERYYPNSYNSTILTTSFDKLQKLFASENIISMCNSRISRCGEIKKTLDITSSRIVSMFSNKNNHLNTQLKDVLPNSSINELSSNQEFYTLMDQQLVATAINNNNSLVFITDNKDFADTLSLKSLSLKDAHFYRSTKIHDLYLKNLPIFFIVIDTKKPEVNNNVNTTIMSGAQPGFYSSRHIIKGDHLTGSLDEILKIMLTNNEISLEDLLLKTKEKLYTKVTKRNGIDGNPELIIQLAEIVQTGLASKQKLYFKPKQ